MRAPQGNIPSLYSIDMTHTADLYSRRGISPVVCVRDDCIMAPLIFSDGWPSDCIHNHNYGVLKSLTPALDGARGRHMFCRKAGYDQLDLQEYHIHRGAVKPKQPCGKSLS